MHSYDRHGHTDGHHTKPAYIEYCSTLVVLFRPIESPRQGHDGPYPSPTIQPAHRGGGKSHVIIEIVGGTFGLVIIVIGVVLMGCRQQSTSQQPNAVWKSNTDENNDDVPLVGNDENHEMALGLQACTQLTALNPNPLHSVTCIACGASTSSSARFCSSCGKIKN
jgi:hypothetical protein